MSYANKADQAAAAKRHYEANKAAIKKRAVVFKRLKNQELTEIAKTAREVPCADCGESHPYYMMDFDHVQGDKADNVCNLIGCGVSVEKLLKEIEKCEVVCANCHRRRTWKRRQELKS